MVIAKIFGYLASTKILFWVGENPVLPEHASYYAHMQ
jgi:hypothetical protein